MISTQLNMWPRISTTGTIVSELHQKSDYVKVTLDCSKMFLILEI